MKYRIEICSADGSVISELQKEYSKPTSAAARKSYRRIFAKNPHARRLRVYKDQGQLSLEPQLVRVIENLSPRSMRITYVPYGDEKGLYGALYQS